jgi:stage II sporulation protein AB (anti-sigma F factor)
MTHLGHERRHESALREEIEAVPEAVPRARRRVVAFARRHGAPEDALGHIRLAVSEAIGNAVMHAYEDDDDPKTIQIGAKVEDGFLTVVVTDTGHGIRSKPSKGQGLGLGLIASSTADFAIDRREPRGTRVRMRFVLDA